MYHSYDLKVLFLSASTTAFVVFKYIRVINGEAYEVYVLMMIGRISDVS